MCVSLSLSLCVCELQNYSDGLDEDEEDEGDLSLLCGCVEMMFNTRHLLLPRYDLQKASAAELPLRGGERREGGRG